MEDNVEDLVKILDYHEKCSSYYKDLLLLVKSGDAERVMEHKKNRKLPQKMKKPKRSNKRCNKISWDDLTGYQLLQALNERITKPAVNSPENVPAFDETVTDLNEIRDIIVDSKNCIDRKETGLLRDYVRLGCWFYHVSLMNYDEFVRISHNCCYDISYVYKLINISKTFYCPRFENLNINISTAIKIYRRVNQALEQEERDSKMDVILV